MIRLMIDCLDKQWAKSQFEPVFVIFICGVYRFTDLGSNHHYLRQLYDLCPHCEEDLLQPVDGGNQSLHPATVTAQIYYCESGI